MRIVKEILFIGIIIALMSFKEKPKNTLINNKPTTKNLIQKKEKITFESNLLEPYKCKELSDFYKCTNYETVWQSKEYRHQVLHHLNNAEKNGLNKNDYDLSDLQSLENQYDDLSDEELVNYDLQFTYNLQKYLTHLKKGKLNPKELYSNWDLEEVHFDVNHAIMKGFSDESFENIFTEFEPKGLVYKKLQNALKIIKSYPTSDFKKIPFTSKITLNNYNPSVIEIKKRLIYWHDLKNKDSVLTRRYDKETFEAIKRFQKRNGLNPDGVIGKFTTDALNITKEQRQNQIIVNMERWRWYNQNPEADYVIVNITDFNLNVIEKKDTIMTKRVVVGKKERPTPILTSLLSTVIFNPTWTIPPTILEKDIIPEMRKDKMYLSRKNISIYDAKNNVINPLLWKEKDAKNYKYIQKPEYDNSLGVMKITFANRFSVYLHDTNHRDLFDQNFRSLSSGCVRVENPLELGKYLINDPVKWSRQKIDNIVATKKTTPVKIKKKYLFYLWYWTAWSENNELIFRPDIYSLDTELYNKLRR